MKETEQFCKTWTDIKSYNGIIIQLCCLIVLGGLCVDTFVKDAAYAKMMISVPLISVVSTISIWEDLDKKKFTWSTQVIQVVNFVCFLVISQMCLGHLWNLLICPECRGLVSIYLVSLCCCCVAILYYQAQAIILTLKLEKEHEKLKKK